MSERAIESPGRAGNILAWGLAGVGLCASYYLFRQGRRLSGRLARLSEELERRQTGPATEGRRTLSAGDPAPEFELTDLEGRRRSLSQWRGTRVLLIFFDPDCSFCEAMAPALASVAHGGADGRPVPVVVTLGDAEKNRRFARGHGLRCPVLLQEELEVMHAYGAPGTPSGYLIDENGLVAGELFVGAQALLEQAGGAARDESDTGTAADGDAPPPPERGNRPLSESRLARDGLAKGDAAPPFTLPRLDGGELSLEDYRGRAVLLVFSDPQCGPCDRLAPRLEKLSRRTPDIQVIMVSRGGEEENRRKALAHGLSFPVVLQKHWEVSRLYAMFATPIAYLIDEGGVIAAHVAVGADPILNLLISAAVMSLLKETKAAGGEADVEEHRQEGEAAVA